MAQLFARKAEIDAEALQVLAAQPHISDTVVGFHAQQAIEKSLKSVMVFNGIGEKTKHDLGRSLELLSEAGIESPPGADWLDELTAYATEFRYEDYLDAEPLDREATLALVAEVRDWAAALTRA